MVENAINAQNIIMTLFKLGVTILVPAVVWITLVAGVVQLATEGIRRLNAALPGSQRFARRSAR